MKHQRPPAREIEAQVSQFIESEREGSLLGALTDLLEWASHQHMEGYEAPEWERARVLVETPFVNQRVTP